MKNIYNRVLVLNHLLFRCLILAVAGFLFFEERGKFFRKLRRLWQGFLLTCVKCPLHRLMLFQFFPVGGAVCRLIFCFPICPVDIDCLGVVYDMPLQFPVLCHAFFQFLVMDKSSVPSFKWFSSQTQKKDAPGFRPVHPDLCPCIKFFLHSTDAFHPFCGRPDRQ